MSIPANHPIHDLIACPVCGQRFADPLADRVRMLTFERDDARREASEHVRGYEGAQVLVHEISQERDELHAALKVAYEELSVLLQATGCNEAQRYRQNKRVSLLARIHPVPSR